MKDQHTSERGQALVLIVLAIVGMFGFSALAIDGGMLYAERRRAQNAADSAVFAAAMAGLNGGTATAIRTAAESQSQINGFVSDSMNKVTVHHPPVAPLAPAQYVGNNQYYMVVITTQFQPFFAQFIYSGKLENTVWAIARAKPSDSVSPGNAIFATGPHKCHAVWFAGNAATVVEGGHVYSSSDQPADSNCAAGKNQGSADVTIKQGSIKTVGGFNNASGVAFDTGHGFKQNVTRETVPNIAPPSCAGLTSYTWDKHRKGAYSISPGIYDKIDIGSGDNVTMQRGIYCLDGDLRANSGGILNGEAGVLLYMRGTAANPSNIKVNGHATVMLHSATGSPLYDANGKDWSGMAIYMDYNNIGMIELNGNGQTQYWGTVYAPGPTANPENASDKTPKCEVNGSGTSINLRTQLICWSVKTSGNAEVNITYRAEELFHEPPMVELSQ
jgi:hypothetical protein